MMKEIFVTFDDGSIVVYNDKGEIATHVYTNIAIILVMALLYNSVVENTYSHH